LKTKTSTGGAAFLFGKRGKRPPPIAARPGPLKKGSRRGSGMEQKKKEREGGLFLKKLWPPLCLPNNKKKQARVFFIV
jgi:hypothetical protein